MAFPLVSSFFWRGGVCWVVPKQHPAPHSAKHTCDSDCINLLTSIQSRLLGLQATRMKEIVHTVRSEGFQQTSTKPRAISPQLTPTHLPISTFPLLCKANLPRTLPEVMSEAPATRPAQESALAPQLRFLFIFLWSAGQLEGNKSLCSTNLMFTANVDHYWAVGLLDYVQELSIHHLKSQQTISASQYIHYVF